MKLLSKLLISLAAISGIGWILKKLFSEQRSNLDEDAEDFSGYDVNDDK